MFGLSRRSLPEISIDELATRYLKNRSLSDSDDMRFDILVSGTYSPRSAQPCDVASPSRTKKGFHFRYQSQFECKSTDVVSPVLFATDAHRRFASMVPI